jgi:hypothetical protein
VPGRPGTPFTIIGRAADQATQSSQTASYQIVSPEYFSVLRIPLREGRTFQLADTANAARVAIINEEMARRFWPGRSPIGQQIRAGIGPREATMTIIAVAGNVSLLTTAIAVAATTATSTAASTTPPAIAASSILRGAIATFEIRRRRFARDGVLAGGCDGCRGGIRAGGSLLFALTFTLALTLSLAFRLALRIARLLLTRRVALSITLRLVGFAVGVTVGVTVACLTLASAIVDVWTLNGENAGIFTYALAIPLCTGIFLFLYVGRSLHKKPARKETLKQYTLPPDAFILEDADSSPKSEGVVLTG